ncbi:MAG: PhoH family protein [Candidatus Nanoarchaeia archaeon]
MTHKIVVGLDVIETGGSEIINSLGRNKDVELFFDRKNVEKQGEQNNPLVREFMDYGFQEGTRDENGFWVIDNGENRIKIKFQSPDSWSECEAMTDDPSTREFFYEKGVQSVEEPDFLKVNPSVLRKGFVSQKTDRPFESLEDIFEPKKEGINVDFPNQFILLNCEDGRQALYMSKKDFEISGPDIDIQSDMYLQRIEPETSFFLGANKSAFEGKHLSFGIEANHLSQYLAWKYLLLDPKIQFVTLSGKAGSGKTLLGYLSGLEQTLIDSEGDINKNFRYKMMRLLKPAVPPNEHQVGYLPGDLEAKLGPQMDSFKTLHDEDITPGFRYSDALDVQQGNKYRKLGLFFPTNKVPLIKEDTIAFAKGSTWAKQMIIVDEAEDMRRSHGRGLATRVGFGSKMIFCGDPYQVENPACSSDKNALVYIAQKLAKEQHPSAAMMNLEKTNRSPIANTVASFHKVD